ncbi:MAG: acyltransferase family protein [Devosia sp.]|uniref:acyltransferase family protein n=1 Tax=Devosia sp. TaxID=1871048 RepID=UPI0033919D22
MPEPNEARETAGGTRIGSSALDYRPDIDGLRAFAVISVVLYHAFPNTLGGGYIGVDVFFVISGYLISSIILTEVDDDRFSFRYFYSRRAKRIFPALAVCLTAVLAYGYVSILPSELAQLGKHVFFGAGFLSNIAIWSEAGYFDTAATQKPLLHLWSLGIEEQFYIVWPALLLLAHRHKIAGKMVLILIAGSFCANAFLSTTSISSDFFLPVSRFWELLTGAAVSLSARRRACPLGARSWLSIVGFSVLVLSALAFKPDIQFPGWWALLPVGAAGSLIIAGPQAAINRTVLSHHAVVFVGLLSYPFYLWHWPLISFAYIIRLGKAPTPLMSAGLVIASFGLAFATYIFIEKPVRFGAQHRARGPAICLAVLAACGLAAWIFSGFPARFPAGPNLDIRKISEATLDSAFAATKGMEVSSHDATVVARLGRGDRKVALSGDSLLFQYGPRVQQLADDGQLAASTYFVAGGSCAPVPGVVQLGDFAHCANMPDLLLELVRREKIQTVVLGASWNGYNAENMWIVRNGRRLQLNGLEGREAFYANLEDYVRLLQHEGATVHLVLAAPVHERFNPREMVVRSLIGVKVAPDADHDVPAAELRASYFATNQRLIALSRRTGAQPLDAFSDICGDGAGCSAFFDITEPKYSDGMHLRPTFVRKHIHFLDSLLR